MSKRKEKLLNKYLDKKRKQRKRDDLLAQIAEIEKNREKNVPRLEKEDTDYESSESTQCQSNKSNESTQSSESRESNESSESKESTESNESIQSDTEKISTFDKFIESDYKNNLVEPPTIKENSEELDLEDFLGEKIHWENIECPHRPPELEEFRKTLPIYYEKSDILTKIRNNTVISIKGETGCGKTTQIPQFLYEGGFKKLIGVTQPRRISTISICNRINSEMGENKSGYQIRYESTVNEETAIKIMTDGILLKEIQSDFLLSKYSVILLDEIHERSANMDLLISLLSRIIKMRKENNDELKLVLMSATSMVDELGKFFDKIALIEVPSNTHRVSIFYEDKDPSDVVQAAYDRISKIIKSRKSQIKDSILCFLPDKSDIYSLLIKLTDRFEDCIVLPLHSSLSKNEQSLIYKDYNQRKIILSTNIAETSITIPDIFYVVDSGLVKRKYVGMTSIVEYSVEYISKSSALQRAGRAGRTGPGICYRLYTGNLFSRFEELDIPKILYESLDEIILNLISLGIEDVFKFPFVNRPTDENIIKSLNDLKRMGVLNEKSELSKLGKYISNLPFPPKISKLLCIPNTQHIFADLLDLACLMSVWIELKRNGSNKNYYVSEKSDLLVILKIYRDFDKDRNKKDFCKRMGVNWSSFNEVGKLQKSMYAKFNIKESMRNILTNDIKNEIRKVIYLVYSDRIALPYDSSYWYKKHPVYLSESSVDTEGEYAVFEYLIKGTKRLYMKNVTVLDKAWFDNK